VRPVNAAFCCTVAALSRPFREEKAPGGGESAWRDPLGKLRFDQRLLLLRRPPPWLALPPLLAISRCLAGSIAAKPRFEPPLLLDPAITSSWFATRS
jgi:hypothetical protein